MNLFWKYLFGKITSTDKLEKAEAELINNFERYSEIEKSLELVEYNKLFHEVKSSTFVDNKKILQNRKYKDTEEYRNSSKFRKLDNSKNIKTYYSVLSSLELEQYLKFKSGPDYEDLGRKKKVKASEKLQELKKFQRSKAYKTYSRFHESYILKEYEELKILVSEEKFNENNKFWENPKRWETTPEYSKEQRYYELAKNHDIIFYNKQNPSRFEPLKAKIETLNEPFDWNTLDKSRWSFGFCYKSSKLIKCHSFANEKQANNNGQNVTVDDGILKITTEHEKIKAAAWHPIKGFIEKEFEYSSDIVQSSSNFRQKNGIFSAKLKCTGKIHHAFWLGTENKLPHINIFHFNGKRIRVGNVNKNVVDGISIRGINPAKYHIYSLKWTDNELIWSINDFEVYRTTSNIPKEAMYLAFNSFITEKQIGDTGVLEIDWVKVYKY